MASKISTELCININDAIKNEWPCRGIESFFPVGNEDTCHGVLSQERLVLSAFYQRKKAGNAKLQMKGLRHD
jgi:hypothetical protein